LLQFDGNRLTARYNYVRDPMLQHNLGLDSGTAPGLELLKGIIQSYMQRMIDNNLIYRAPPQKNKMTRRG